MSYSPSQSMRYSEFVQACRAFKPSELLPEIARISAELKEPPYSANDMRRMPPWGLAAAARESLLHGNEHRSKPVDERALLGLMHKFQLTEDNADHVVNDPDFFVKMATRLSYEQFPYQESIFEELSRSHAWLIEGLLDVKTRVVTRESLAALFDGVPLDEAIGATFFLQVGAFQNSGVYDPGWLDQPKFTDVLNVYSRSGIETIACQLTATPETFRDSFNLHSLGTDAMARFDYNPLVATPFIDMGNGRPIAPATRLILRTVTPGGIYYKGIAQFGSAFADDLGRLFEHYIGRQLKLIDGARVEPEIVFGKGGGQKSVDWFVILSDLVLLVEVKSRRLGPAARAGASVLMDSLNKTLRGARAQLSRTVGCLSDKHPAFKHIPSDRPILALIVTAEPFYTGTSYLHHQDLMAIPGGDLGDVPVVPVSAREIEMFVTHGKDIGPMLLEQMAKATDGMIDLRDIGQKTGANNPILANAWESYPWPSRELDRPRT